MESRMLVDERIRLLKKINEKLTNLNWITAQIAGEKNPQTINNSIVNGFKQITGIPKCGLFKHHNGKYEPLIIRNKDINSVPVLCDGIAKVFDSALEERVRLVWDLRSLGYCPNSCVNCDLTELQVCTLYESNGNPNYILSAYGKSDVSDRDTLFMIIELYAMQTGLILENASLNNKLLSLSNTDALTGLYNHRFFCERIEKEFLGCRNGGKNLTLLLVDVDDFKSYNDTYGHPEGNYVLENISHLLKSTVGNKGITCRYGGEEMAVIMPGISLKEGVLIGGKICEVIGQCNCFKRKVTVSIGVADVKKNILPSDLIRLADDALYMAKAQGKNRVVAGRQ